MLACCWLNMNYSSLLPALLTHGSYLSGYQQSLKLLALFSVNLSAGEQKGDHSACLVGFTKAEHL